jgi:23S rRNA (guanosine2251-2'-O)-methyltransferase
MADPDYEEELIFGKNAVLAFLEKCQLQNKEKKSEGHGSHGFSDKTRRNSKTQNTFDASVTASATSSATSKDGVSVNKVYIASGSQHDKRLEQVRDLCRDLKIPIIEAERKRLDQMLPRDQIHQGIIAQVSKTEFLTLEDFFQSLDQERAAIAHSGQKDPINSFAVAVLDGIEDPHNLGAIVRVAEAAGFKAIILPNRRSAGITGTVAKTSAGALAHMPIVRITNLVSALTKLKDYGFWVAGLSVESSNDFFKVDLERPMAIVIGSEGGGIGRLVEKNCDMLLRIPMLGKTQSLNASVAAGIVFYEFVRQQAVKDEPRKALG